MNPDEAIHFEEVQAAAAQIEEEASMHEYMATQASDAGTVDRRLSRARGLRQALMILEDHGVL